MWARTHPRDAQASEDAVGKPTNFQLVGVIYLFYFSVAILHWEILLIRTTDGGLTLGNRVRPGRIQCHIVNCPNF